MRQGGWGASRSQARQFVRHGHVTVNGKRVTIPSFRVRKGDVVATLRAGCYVNLAGLASTLLGLQATVGLLVAKTLTNATANPFLAGGAGSYSPVLALDVFLVQASTNTALAHFVSLVASLWLIKVVGAPVPATGPSGAR